MPLLAGIPRAAQRLLIAAGARDSADKANGAVAASHIERLA